MKKSFLTGVVTGILLLGACSEGGGSMGFRITSPDFKENDAIPKKFSCEGDDISPELKWEDPPAGTRSFALIVEDPDAPGGTFTHWVVYDMPSHFKNLYRGMGNDRDLTNGIKFGKTDFGQIGYGGPCPPRGHGRHRYIFVLKALDIQNLGLPPGARRVDVEKAMEGHILGEAKTMGVYKR